MAKYVIPILIVIIVVLLTLIVYFYKKRYKDGIKDFLSLLFQSGFDNKVKGFREQNKYIKQNGVLFLGDSITQDYNVYEYFSDLTVYNRGIGGDTTIGLMKRLDESVFQLNPKTIILLIGTNDFAMLKTTPVEIKNRIEKIIIEIKNKLDNVNIHLLSIYPVNENIDPLSVKPRNNKDIQVLNNLLETIPNINYINIFDILKDDESNLARKYTYDGLHLNEQGYIVVTKVLKEILKEA